MATKDSSAPLRSSAHFPVFITLLGSFKLILKGTEAAIGDGSHSEVLVSVLALARGRRVSRAALCEQLWPGSESDNPSGSLNSLTYRLNKSSADAVDSGLVLHETGYYRLNSEAGVQVDIDLFDDYRRHGRRLMRTGDIEEGIALYRDALVLYRGDLYAAADVSAVVERERLRADFLDLLICVAHYHYDHDQCVRALDHVHTLLHHDPCREDGHRLAMRCYLRMGQRAQALRQYALCRDLLADVFEVPPEPATEQLVRQIRLDPQAVL